MSRKENIGPAKKGGRKSPKLIASATKTHTQQAFFSVSANNHHRNSSCSSQSEKERERCREGFFVPEKNNESKLHSLHSPDRIFTFLAPQYPSINDFLRFAQKCQCKGFKVLNFQFLRSGRPEQESEDHPNCSEQKITSGRFLFSIPWFENRRYLLGRRKCSFEKSTNETKSIDQVNSASGLRLQCVPCEQLCANLKPFFIA